MGEIRGLKIGADFRDYKSDQEQLQIRAALWIPNVFINMCFYIYN